MINIYFWKKFFTSKSSFHLFTKSFDRVFTLKVISWFHLVYYDKHNMSPIRLTFWLQFVRLLEFHFFPLANMFYNCSLLNIHYMLVSIFMPSLHMLNFSGSSPFCFIDIFLTQHANPDFEGRMSFCFLGHTW